MLLEPGYDKKHPARQGMPCWVLDCFKRVDPSGSVFELDVPLIQWPVAEIHFPYYLVTVDESEISAVLAASAIVSKDEEFTLWHFLLICQFFEGEITCELAAWTFCFICIQVWFFVIFSVYIKFIILVGDRVARQPYDALYIIFFFVGMEYKDVKAVKIPDLISDFIHDELIAILKGRHHGFAVHYIIRKEERADDDEDDQSDRKGLDPFQALFLYLLFQCDSSCFLRSFR